MKNTYCRQKYLFEEDHSDLELSSLIDISRKHDNVQDYNVPYNLLDCNLPYVRKISTDVLDEQTDTFDEFQKIVAMISDVDELILIDSRKKNCNSEIIDNFSEITLKAYISLFYKCGIKKIIIAQT
ncbi:MAG: hypothetical protein IJL67_02630 [Oscillospiraceae bacterium]|nr:hypothetical protein [Oscillospiraceae bacterium]